MCSACSDNEYRETIEADARARRTEAEPMRVVCAWHGKYFGAELVMTEGAGPFTSHGICEDCRFIEEHRVQISAVYECPPIPTRNFDWMAVDSNTYDANYEGEDETGHHWKGGPIGWGATREEAVRSLVEGLRERAA